MPPVPALAEILAGAADLLALAALPPLLSPAPPPPASPLLEGALAVVALSALVAGAVRLRARFASREALAGAGLLVLAVVASLVGAVVFRGERAPLGRGVLFVAVPLWLGLAAVAAAVVRRRFDAKRRGVGIAAALLVVGLGAGQLAASSRWLSSPVDMWWEALRKDGSNTAALDALLRAPPVNDQGLVVRPFGGNAGTADPARAHDPVNVMRILDRCLALRPDACACLARRADAGVRSRAIEKAVADGRAAVAACPADPGVRSSLAVALAYHGDGELAEQEARAGLQRGDDPRLHYALARAYEREGRQAEAMAEIRIAVERGAGRDAGLMLAALSINAGDLETANKTLAPLVAADPGDAEAQYDLALVADKQDHFNPARQGYLAALRADPQYADARYNVALLTLRHGVVDEARHHAVRFREVFPNDPRAEELMRTVNAVAFKK